MSMYVKFDQRIINDLVNNGELLKVEQSDE